MLKHSEITIKRINGEGNYFFWCISYFSHATEEQHAEIRNQIVHEVSLNWGEYKAFIVGDRSDGVEIFDVSDYKTHRSENGKYGGHVELVTATKLYPYL